MRWRDASEIQNFLSAWFNDASSRQPVNSCHTTVHLAPRLSFRHSDGRLRAAPGLQTWTNSRPNPTITLWATTLTWLQRMRFRSSPERCLLRAGACHTGCERRSCAQNQSSPCDPYHEERVEWLLEAKLEVSATICHRDHAPCQLLPRNSNTSSTVDM